MKINCNINIYVNIPSKAWKQKFLKTKSMHILTYESTIVTFDYLFSIRYVSKIYDNFSIKIYKISSNIDATVLFKFNIILYSMKKKNIKRHMEIYLIRLLSKKYISSTQHTQLQIQMQEKKWRFGILKCKESIREKKGRMEMKTEHTVLLSLEKTVEESKYKHFHSISMNIIMII